MKKIKYLILIIISIFSIIKYANAIDYIDSYTSSWNYTVSNSSEVYVNNWLANLSENLVYKWRRNENLYDWAYDVVVDGNYT
jgi:hypothetical protein